MSKNSKARVLIVTGGIGSGKSKVCEIMSKNGAVVISADILARTAMNEAMTEIKTKFTQAFSEDGSLDRNKLSKIVFSDSNQRLELEKILHPIIQKLADLEFDKAFKNGDKFVVYECPLFYEVRMNKKDYRGVIVVDAPEEICITRVSNRDSLNKTDIKMRMENQASREDRIYNADYIINNSGSLEQLEDQVKQLISQFS